MPITTPAPGIREKAGQSVEAATAQAQADKQAALKKAADAKMGVSEDLNYVNETWVNITQRQLFPHVTINRDVESFSAAVLMLLGLFAGLVGFQYARVVFVGLAFVAGRMVLAVYASCHALDGVPGTFLPGVPVEADHGTPGSPGVGIPRGLLGENTVYNHVGAKPTWSEIS